AARELGGLDATSAGPALDLLPGKEVLLGESTRVRRLLPTLGRRLVGAWAFVDHYGPDDAAPGPGLQGPAPVRGLVLRGPLRRGGRRLRAGDAGAAAPAHRPADGVVAAGRFGAPP